MTTRNMTDNKVMKDIKDITSTRKMNRLPKTVLFPTRKVQHMNMKDIPYTTRKVHQTQHEKHHIHTEIEHT